MKDNNPYTQHMNVKFGHLETIDVPALVEECSESWFNQTLTKVNGSVARLGVVEGDYHWHKHDEDDEFFFVLEGTLFIDLEGQTVRLERHQGLTVPKGVLHRPRAPERVVMLMVETATIDPLGDS